MSQEFKTECQNMRTAIEGMKKVVRDEMMDCVVECGPENLGEARANIKLAYRHLEDARMRFGKAIQAADGGVTADSEVRIYNKNKPVVAGEKADKDF